MDVYFENRSLTVRAGKGNKDRVTLLPEKVIPALRNHLTRVAQLHKTDLLRGAGYTPMPNALYRKYPTASMPLAWHYVFPSTTVRVLSHTGQQVRWHCSPTTLRRAFRKAAKKARQFLNDIADKISPNDKSTLTKIAKTSTVTYWKRVLIYALFKVF